MTEKVESAEERQVFGVPDTLLCAKMYISLTSTRNVTTQRSLVKGVSGRPRAIHGREARKSIITRRHSADFVPYCRTQAASNLSILRVKGWLYELADDDRTSGPKNCAGWRDLLDHREQSRAIHTTVKPEFPLPIKGTEMIFSSEKASKIKSLLTKST